MKIILGILLVILSCNGSYGQKQSDLYVYIDSLIYNDLKFTKDTIEKTPYSIQHTLKTSPEVNKVHPRHSIVPATEPLLVFNGAIVDKQILNSFHLVDIKIINVLHPGNYTSSIYGSRAIHGVIVIEGANKKVSRKIKRITGY